MTEVELLAAFVLRATYDDLSSEARHELKIRIVDSLGCAIGALEAAPITMLKQQIAELGGRPLVTMIGGAKTAPDRAALYNAALIRYLDYNDSFLARHGITGPLEVFEGNKGFKETIAGPFSIDWGHEGLEAVQHTILKRYNAEIHSQSALEGTLDLRRAHHVLPQDIVRIELEIFDVAYHIIGGGDEGNKHLVHTKEEADHSLPYLLAVALLDGEVGPAQYRPERIVREDVQTLLRLVTVRPDAELSRRFPKEMPCRLSIVLNDGQALRCEKTDYDGFLTRPMRWDTAVAKFERLSAPYTDLGLRQALIEAVAQLDTIMVRDLTALLATVEGYALDVAGEPFDTTYVQGEHRQTPGAERT